MNLDKILRDIISPKQNDVPEIWNKIAKLWKSFDKAHPNPIQWSKDEGLEGLCPNPDAERRGMAGDVIDEIEKYLPYSRKELDMMPTELLTRAITTFLLGVRIGNALAKERIDHESK